MEVHRQRRGRGDGGDGAASELRREWELASKGSQAQDFRALTSPCAVTSPRFVALVVEDLVLLGLRELVWVTYCLRQWVIGWVGD